MVSSLIQRRRKQVSPPVGLKLVECEVAINLILTCSCKARDLWPPVGSVYFTNLEAVALITNMWNTSLMFASRSDRRETLQTRNSKLKLALDNVWEVAMTANIHAALTAKEGKSYLPKHQNTMAAAVSPCEYSRSH